ncbi:MAG: peptidylprolyl isomerase [Candidatus Hermodarchaeota archaeon]
MAIKKGDKVKVDYTGTLEDGTVFDTSEGNEPLEFEVGSGQLIKGFDEAVIGMVTGEEKEIKLDPADAYGDYNAELTQTVPRDTLPKEPEPKPGMSLLMVLPDGKRFPVTIAEVTDEEVILDLNHPLAGKTLIFKIKIVETPS